MAITTAEPMDEYLAAESTARAYIGMHEREIDRLNDLDNDDAREFAEFLEPKLAELVKDYERHFRPYPQRGPV